MHFAAHAPNLKSMDSLQRYFSALSAEFPFRYFTYFCSRVSGGSGRVETVTSYPEAWRTHYFLERCELTDPVLRTGRNSFLPVNWSRIENLSTGERRFFEASYDFGLGKHGITVPVRGPQRETAFVSVNAENPPSKWWDDMHLGLADLTYFGFLLHQHIAKLAEVGSSPPEHTPSSLHARLKF